MNRIIALALTIGVSNMALAAENTHRLQPTASEWKQIEYSRQQERLATQQRYQNQFVANDGTRTTTQRVPPQAASKSRHEKKLIGGLIGGYLGNRLFRNNSHLSRNGATVAGVLIGSAIAKKANHSGYSKPKSFGSARHGRHDHHRNRDFGYSKPRGYGYSRHRQYGYSRHGGFSKHRKFGHRSKHRNFGLSRHGLRSYSRHRHH